MLSQQEWHDRYVQQARWTSSVRRFLFQQVSAPDKRAVLEVGCGSGAILGELREQFQTVYGIDFDINILHLAHYLRQDETARLVCADGLHLPFLEAAFSLTCCHFYLLWVTDPLQAVREMRRVTRVGGYVLALAEPDYGGRIDYPEGLAKLGQLQREALLRQGADPLMGRKVKALFHRAGLRNVRAGVLGGEWGEPPEPGFMASEWKILESDLSILDKPENFGTLKELDVKAWQNGERILYVPTFYAAGQV